MEIKEELESDITGRNKTEYMKFKLEPDEWSPSPDLPNWVSSLD